MSNEGTWQNLGTSKQPSSPKCCTGLPLNPTISAHNTSHLPPQVGPSRVSVKLQPGITFSELLEPEADVLAQLEHLGPELASRGLAYVCLSSLNGEPYYKFVGGWLTRGLWAHQVLAGHRACCAAAGRVCSWPPAHASLMAGCMSACLHVCLSACLYAYMHTVQLTGSNMPRTGCCTGKLLYLLSSCGALAWAVTLQALTQAPPWHLPDPSLPAAGLSEPNLKTDVFKFFRQRYSGSLMINGGLAIEQGNAYCADGTADLVAFGTPFIANANLPELVAAGYGHGQLNAGECVEGAGHDAALLVSCGVMQVQARTRFESPHHRCTTLLCVSLPACCSQCSAGCQWLSWLLGHGSLRPAGFTTQATGPHAVMHVGVLHRRCLQQASSALSNPTVDANAICLAALVSFGAGSGCCCHVLQCSWLAVHSL